MKEEPKEDSFKIIHNSYTKRRGVSQIMDIYCSDCQCCVMAYQKDGPGPLLRCYLDRIHLPLGLRDIQFEAKTKALVPPLLCPLCGFLIGTAMMYKPEKRLAYRLVSTNHFTRPRS